MLQFFLTQIFPGVLSSLIAVVAWETGKWLMEKNRHRKLRRVLSIKTRTCNIVTATRQQDTEGDLLAHRDAYAFGHLFELCHRLGIEPELFPHTHRDDLRKPADLIILGGPLNNQFTERFLKEFCPGFSLVHGQPTTENYDLRNQPFVSGFQLGSRQITPEADEDFAMLIKIDSGLLSQSRTVHLLFGYGSIGTAAAAYYLASHFGKIHSRFSASRYCIGFRVPKIEGYKNVPLEFTDFTTEVFAD